MGWTKYIAFMLYCMLLISIIWLASSPDSFFFKPCAEEELGR